MTLKNIYTLCFCLLAATGFCGCKRSEANKDTTVPRIQYEISNAIFPNPERGFIKTMPVFSEGNKLGTGDVTLLRSQNVTMILRFFYLDAFKDKAISNAELSLIEADLATIRNAGLKAILRFAYTDDMQGTDAPYAIIEQHLDQLKAVFENNRDIIAFVQAGFIGAWGEWHSSSNGLATVENEKLVLNKLLSVLPPDIMVQVRTPSAKQQLFNTTSPLTDGLAYSGDNRARVGHHNDCFLTGGTDYGTYNNVEAEKQYISTEALYVPTGGETCPPTGGYDPTCAEGRREMALLKWTYLSLDWYQPTINAWKSSGCFDEFQRYLGYRLALVDALFPDKATTNSNMPVDINITNKGYAPLYNKKKIYLVFKNVATGDFYDKELSADLRLCKPSVTQNISGTVSLSGIPGGGYELFLRITDQDAVLAERPEYAIQLANNNTWLTAHNGINRLNKQITITNN